MKQRIAWLIVFVMAFGLLAGCSKGGEKTTEPVVGTGQAETGQAKTGQDKTGQDKTEQAKTGEDKTGQSAAGQDANQYLNVILAAEPSVLDVARFISIYDRSVFYNILEPLVRLDNGQVSAAGAESWEISEDGLTYTFHLRENYWSDGTRVTAKDYAEALKRQADPANAFTFASDYYSIKNFQAVNNGEKGVEDLGIETPDDSTLVLHLEDVNVTLLTMDFFPCKEGEASQYGDTLGTEADKVSSCGPFVLTEWTHNSTLEFEKNEKYWNRDSVSLSRFTYHIIPDSNAQLASLENGTLDYLNVSDMDYVEKFSAREDMSTMMVSAGRTVMVVFNCEDPLFGNQKVRQAFALALDREALAEVITSGTGTPAYGLVPSDCTVGQYNYRAQVEEPLLALKAEYDTPDKIKALFVEGLEEAGQGNDPAKVTVKFAWGATTAVARTYAELYQQLWQTLLGCKVELEFNDSATHMSNIGAGNYQMASSSWGNDPEPNFILGRWATKIGGQSRWKNEEYVELVSRAVTTIDDKERLECYQKAEELLLRDCAASPLYYTASRRFYYNYVGGFSDSTFDTMGMMKMYTKGR